MFQLCLSIIMLSYAFAAQAADSLPIAQFSAGHTQGWEEKSFSGNTRYTLKFDPQRQQQVLQAQSHGTASGLFHEQRIDLNQTPFLHWSWKADSLYQGIDEREKSGDDFVARIYVVIDGGYFFWRTLALNYVWSSSHQKGQTWANPYTANATMFAVEAGNQNIGTWQSYKRNVQQDLKQLLGKDVQYIDAIAIMTDSDGSQQQATTSFGDIFFTAH